MYLSRLKLNPRHRRVQSELARPYELHRSVLRAFPEVLPADERVLFRVDVAPQSGLPSLLVQSQHAPDWHWAQEERGYLLAGTRPEVKQVELSLADGQLLAFRLRANPTVKKATHQREPSATPGYVAEAKRLRAQGEPAAPGHNGIRLGLAREEDQRAWLQRQGERCGFAIERLLIIPEGLQTGLRPVADAEAGAKPRRMAHLAVRFEGLLRVTNAGLLQEAVRSGIGSAKGFGFGLLSLGPPRLASTE